ncbi:DUF3450 family protein [Pelagicoccus sp. SDUM812003]|uniref:DUF3450 family protein n=1 Tax=Pelagicoccus sp. SDUM812003 TaxID=3041267 RepID=UPI00280C5AAF|nr:DUF3450 family protein [Pelagicoccus sp. SDUM812003]MDQ8205227.1 DUF3450 family protein [Pelagicoccus sp. SDUM812003]
MEHFKKAAFLGFLTCVGFASAAPTNALYEETKSTVTQWAETESLISKELNDWKKEKAILEDMARMLESERETLAAKIEETRDSATEADKRRSEVVDRKEALEEASDVVRSELEALEAGVRSLVPYFPSKYAESIAPLIRQLPKEGKDTQLSLSVRMRNVVGILSQANKFDNVISLETETREVGDGVSKQVKTLYFGFAIAYYADATGEHAGYGYPTAEGWKWKSAPEYGAAILDALSMYEKGKQAEFVELPVVIN